MMSSRNERYALLYDIRQVKLRMHPLGTSWNVSHLIHPKVWLLQICTFQQEVMSSKTDGCSLCMIFTMYNMTKYVQTLSNTCFWLHDISYDITFAVAAQTYLISHILFFCCFPSKSKNCILFFDPSRQHI